MAVDGVGAAVWHRCTRWWGKRPAAVMLVAIACFAPLPLLIWAGVQDTTPLLLVGLWNVSACVVYAAAIQTARGTRGQVVILDDVRAARPRYFWASAVLRANWFLFAGAVALAPVAIVTVLFEAWPVLFAVVLLSGWWRTKMLDGAALDRSAAISTLVFLMVGISGVALAVLSDIGSESWSRSAAGGIALALLAPAATAVASAAEQMMGAIGPDGKKVEKEHRSPAEQSHISASGGALGGGVLGSALIAAACVWLAIGGTVNIGWVGLLCAVGAAPLQMAGNWLFQHANHLARREHGQSAAQVNSLYYLVPVAALVLLAAFADISIERSDLLIAGAAGVVAVNMVMHLDPEGAQQRAHQSGAHGYKAIVLSLWVCGTLVLLRDDWLPDGWQVWSLVEYWGMIAVFATVFTLILAFRQSRLSERRREMDSLFLSLHHRIEHMGRTGDLSGWAAPMSAARLRRIDTARTPHALSVQYLRLRRTLVNEIHSSRDPAAAERLSATLADVETLVNLRQQARNFAELAVLTMLAAVACAMAVTARPAGIVVPFAGWAHDTASLVIAAVFAFLGFDLIDKRREADAPLLRRVTRVAHKHHRQPPGWRLEMVAYQDSRVERLIASLLGGALLAGAIIMVGFKWL